MANEFKIRKGLIVTGASGGTVVDIQGSQGQLFSVTDNLSGSIFAVSDISGVPIFTVNSSGLSTFDGNVLVGSDSSLLLSNNATVSAYAGTNDSLYLNSKGSGIVRVNFAGGTGGFEVYAGGTSSIFDVSPAGAGTFAGSVRAEDMVAIYAGTKVLQLKNVNNVFSIRNGNSGVVPLTIDAAGEATFIGLVNGITPTANANFATKQYVDGLITGATIYRGVWQAGISATSTGATTASTTLTVSAAILDSDGNTPDLVDAIITGAGITAVVKVASITSPTVYELDTAISATATAYIFSPEYGAPDLSLETQVSGYYYICSEAGIATPNGAGTEPNTWSVGDWVIWNDDLGASGQWQKIDNTSVISGAGTGQKVTKWEGTAGVAGQETLTDGPISFSASDDSSLFAGRATFQSAVADRPQLPGGFLGIDTSDADADIWGISQTYYPSNPTTASAWGLKWGSTPNQFQWVGAGVNRITFDLDQGNIVTLGSVSATQFNPTNIVTNKVVKFDGTTLNDSNITDTGSLVTVASISTFSEDAYFTKQGAAAYGSINLENEDPFIRLYDNGSGSTTDKKKWDIRVIGASGSEQFDIRTINDANTVFSTKLSIAHSGSTTINSDTDIPYLTLNTASTTNKRVRLQFTQGGNAGMEIGTDFGVDDSSNFYFYDRVAGSAMFFTSIALSYFPNGDVLVGKTTNTIATAGAKIGATTGTNITRDSNEVLYLNRTTNFGKTLSIAKDGTTIGEIGTYSGVPYIGYSGGGGGGIMFNGLSIEPTAVGASRTSGTNDVGSPNYKWKNGWFNGNLYSYGAGLVVEGAATDQYFIQGKRTGNSGPTFSVYDNSSVAYINSYQSMSFRANQHGGTGGNFGFTGGKVGIGTGSPTFGLTVSGGGANTNPATVEAPYIGEELAFKITNSAWTSTNGLIRMVQPAGAYANNSTMTFSTEQGSLTEKMRITNGGDVGIGTTTPNAKLDIQGSQGQLFSVTDDLSGSIFAVADISGVPIFDVNSSGVSTFDGDVDIKTSFGGSNFYQLGVGTTSSGSIYTEGRIFGGGDFYVVGEAIFNGNVGIGVTGPVSKLEVFSTATNTATFKNSIGQQTVTFGSTTNTAYSDIVLKTNSGTGEIFKAGTGYTSWGGALALNIYNSNGAIAFHPNSVTNAMFIATSGDVGIGANASSTIYPLDVHDATTSGVIIRAKGIGAMILIESNTAGEAYLYQKPNITGDKEARFMMTAGTSYGWAWSDDGSGTPASRVKYMKLDQNPGTLTVKGDVIAYGTPSDISLKENIKPIDSALDKVMKLQGVTFDWKKTDSILELKEDIGFIAQDVQKVVPELIRENSNGLLSMRHQGVAPILLEAIKELKAEIDLLKSKPCTCNKCNCNI